MRTIIWFIYFWGSLLALMPALHRAKKADASGDTATRDAIVTDKVLRWCRTLLKLAGVTITVEGRENIPNQPVVFVSNHQGNFDIPLLLSCLDKPHGLVAKESLRKLPFVRDWMKLLGCVFIDRSNARQSVTAMGDASRMLVEEDRSFIVFPEGTRSRGGEMKEFKSGAFRIACKAGAPVLPICIDGSWRVMEGNKNWIRPAHVRITILPPIPTSGMTKEQSRLLGEQVRRQVVSCLS